MSMDAEIYAAVLRRIAEVDHGWGQQYEFQAIYVLDHAVPAVEVDMHADIKGTERERRFDDALKAALQARLPTYQISRSFKASMMCTIARGEVPTKFGMEAHLLPLVL